LPFSFCLDEYRGVLSWDAFPWLAVLIFGYFRLLVRNLHVRSMASLGWVVSPLVMFTPPPQELQLPSTGTIFQVSPGVDRNRSRRLVRFSYPLAPCANRDLNSTFLHLTDNVVPCAMTLVAPGSPRVSLISSLICHRSGGLPEPSSSLYLSSCSLLFEFIRVSCLNGRCFFFPGSLLSRNRHAFEVEV